MRKITKPRPLIVLVGVLAIVGIAAGGVVAAQLGPSPDVAELQAAIEKDALVRVVDIPASSTAPARGVFVQFTSTGHLCLWEAPSATSRERGGGCNSADDPLAGRELTVSLGYDGGPSINAVSDARLMGLVSARVAAVQVLMSDGTRRNVPLRRVPVVSLQGSGYSVFGYRFPRMDFERRIGPTAVVALDASGKEIDRQTTGFGG
jgi:hypothetical protein